MVVNNIAGPKSAAPTTTRISANEVVVVDQDEDDSCSQMHHHQANNRNDDRTILHGAIAGTGSSFQEAALGMLGGAVFGMVSPVVGHPFDLVKTRMQAELQYHQTTVRETVRSIYRSEGIWGFYRGFWPPLIGSIAFRGVLFSAYSGTYAACSHVPLLHDPIPHTGGLRPSVLLGALAAAFARASIESPLDFLKVRFMTGQKAHHSHNTVQDWIQQSTRSPLSTLSHLYHGFTPTLLRTIGLLGSFFVLVDYSVRWIPDVVNAPVVGPFFKGGICATLAWLPAYPFESVKSLKQGHPEYKDRTTWSIMKELIKKGRLYRGFLPGASRSFVANGTSMTVYSWFQETIRGSTT